MREGGGVGRGQAEHRSPASGGTAWGGGGRQASSDSLSAAPSPAGAVGRAQPDQLSGDRLGLLGTHCPLRALASRHPLGPQCPVFKVRVESLSVPLGGE